MARDFGAAEALDSLAIRPLMLVLCPMMFGFVVGTTVGSLSADVLFYAGLFIIKRVFRA